MMTLRPPRILPAEPPATRAASNLAAPIRRTRLLAALVGLGLGRAAAADMTWTFAVQVSAASDVAPPRIELSWPTDPFPIQSYTVSRKAVHERSWPEGVPLPGDATGFTDHNVEPGRVYEYQIVKHAQGYTGYGYIAAGIHAPLQDNRGRVILVVDDAFSGPLEAQLARLQLDLAGDGWTVVRKEVSRHASPAEVKAQIRAEYEADRERTQAVFLLGHIPIVRSGNLNVDGHGARPMPADAFYGDMDGLWTDANGDGIYDQSTLPSDVELQVGRVDFANLPGTYSPVPYPSETELMRTYLDKLHAFRHAVVRPRARALVGNAVGDAGGQAYAASGYRNFAALVGAANVTTSNSDPGTPDHERWMHRLAADDYLWAYAGGAGSDFSVGAMGSHPPFGDAWASDFLQYRAKGTFYLMFGSWFSDWSKPDNIMRTALAAPEHGLAAAWSGRPHLFYHHMGAGETIGFGMRTSQNNAGLYQNQVQRQLRGVHIALLGDPTLRQHVIAPPRDAAVRADGGQAVVSWTPSPDAVLGYHVYRGSSPRGPFSRVSNELIRDARFTDPARDPGQPVYQVRAVTLTVGASGTYFNASQAAFATLDGPAAPAPAPEMERPPAASGLPQDVVWVDDATPPGAVGFAENDSWQWVEANPAPYSGIRAHQSQLAAGLHHHFFAFATSPLVIHAGDVLYAHVFLDPQNPPRQVMLTWLADNWEHRAYWGENLIAEGADGTAGRRYMGPLPAAGQWVRLEIPASAVGLENQTATGMGFTLFDGRATWDRAGKMRP